MTWKTVERPGVFGKQKAKIVAQYNEQYGVDNWRIVHRYRDKLLDFLGACKVFEEAYFQDLSNRAKLWLSLRTTARDVYDIDESDTESGLDYLIQNNVGTHIQDIAIRNVFQRIGWTFQGTKLVQIRSTSKPFGERLSPGRVKFHKPELIVTPHLEGWWNTNSVEDFYQSNKLLQYRDC